MSEPLTAADLDAIEARLKAATPGPWRYNKSKCYRPGTNGAQAVTTAQEAVFATPLGPTIAITGDANDPQSMADADFIAHAPADIARLLAEVRRLTPAAKVRRLSPTVKAPRKPPCKVAVWGPVRGDWGVAALRVNKRIKAHYNVWEGTWLAYTDGVGAKYFATEPEARAHIEAWARGKGWEVRDGE